MIIGSSVHRKQKYMWRWFGICVVGQQVKVMSRPEKNLFLVLSP